MRIHLRLLLLGAACLLTLAACDRAQPPAASSGSEPPAASGSTPPPADEPAALSKEDALRLLSEDIDTEAYMILDASTKTTVDGEDYYVFIVANRADNKPVGQIAVGAQTGEKYNYEGEGVLGAYADFSLYDPASTSTYAWEGLFSDGSSTLELLPMDDHAFEYTITTLSGDTLSGVAYITGNTANDEQNGQTFTFDVHGDLTLAGKAEGVFSAAT